jgi:protoheme IX farnesyltransferase
MLPVTHGSEYTRLQILFYTVLLSAVTIMPFATRLSGWLYLLGAAISTRDSCITPCGCTELVTSWRARPSVTRSIISPCCCVLLLIDHYRVYIRGAAIRPVLKIPSPCGRGLV